MRFRIALFLSAAILGLTLRLSAPPLHASGPAEKPHPQRPSGLPAVILEYLEKNYGLTEDWLKLSRWIPQTRPELLSGPPRRSVLADVPLPAGYTSTTAGARLLFPHVVDGSLAAGGKFYQTVFALAGNQFNDASGTIEFFQDNGAPMSVTLNGVTGNRFPVSLKKDEAKRLTTSGSGDLKAGWARVLTDQPITGGISFGIRDAAGAIFADVGVDEAPAGKDFTLFADTKGDTDTGLALVNPSAAESITLRLELFRSDGSSMGVENVPLPPLGHTARFVSQLFSRVAGIADFEGSVRVTSDKYFCGTTLRIIGDQMTTLPMLPTKPSFLENIVLPQIANGSSPAAGIRYATTLVIFNHNAGRVTGVVRFHASDGTAANLVFGGTAGSEFPFEIAAKGVLRLSSDASGSLQTGWAEVVPAYQGIQAAAVFHVQDLSGRLVTEVGVQGIVRSRQFRIAADTLGPFDTGLAVANTDDNNATGVQLSLYDSAGTKKAETCLALGPLQHTAVFLTQLFRNVPGIEEFSGFLAVTGTRSLGILSLRAVEEKLTSVPAARTKLGFRPIAVMSLLQEASGASPPVRWQVRTNGLDLAVARASFSAPAMGLRLDKVTEKMPFAAGFIYGDNVAGLFKGQVMSMVDLLFADKVTGNSVEFDFQELHGKLSGSPSGGLKLELTPISPSDPGSTTVATDLDIELYLPAGMVTTPAGMRSTDIVTEFVSVPVSAEYISDELTSTIRQNHPLTPADPAKAQISNLEPHFLIPGALLKITGTNLGSQPRFFFRMRDGSDVEADLLDLSSGVMSVQVPSSGIPSEIRVDSGTGAGLPVKVKVPFAPTFELWSATRTGGAFTPFSFILRQEDRQLATAGLETTIYGVDFNPAALMPGAVVGSSWLSGASIAQAWVGRWNLKVESAAADTAVLKVVPLNSDEPAGRLTLEKVTDRYTGIRIEYAPVVAASTGGLSLSVTSQYFAAERVYNFTGVPLQLPAAGKRVFGGVAIESIPFGEGKPPVTVQHSFSFKTESGSPQLQTTSTTAPPPTTTTTTFPCQPTSLATTTTSSSSTTSTTLWPGVKAGSLYAVDSIVGNLRFVPAGIFNQGTPSTEYPQGQGETPQFQHTLTKNLAVMETEVSRQMWADLRARQSSLPADPTDKTYGSEMANPVQSMLWREAVLFANLLSQQLGLQRAYFTDRYVTTPITSGNYITDEVYVEWNANGYRLPTEGEWEYFARAGTSGRWFINEPGYRSSSDNTCTSGYLAALESVAWFCANSGGAAHPVGSKAANPWGLKDVFGNVSEWCWDWYGGYADSAQTDFRGASSGSYRVIRSGYWGNLPEDVRSSSRIRGYPTSRSYGSSSYNSGGGGFRLVRSVTSPPPTTSTVFGTTTTTSSSSSSSLRATTSTTTSTLRPTTTSSSTVPTTLRPTTTSSTSTSSTVRPTTTTTTRPSTTTTLPAGGCNLFADDFNRGNYNGWTPVPGFPGTWQVLNGVLQVFGLAAGDEALILRPNLPAPNYFELNLDLQALSFSGPYQGFQPYSNVQQFRLSNGMVTDGIGAAVDASGNVGFLVYDLKAGAYLLLEKQSYGPVQSVGIRYSSSGITLIVNRAPRLIIAATLNSPPSIENLSLVATGPGILRFDNVCQSVLAPLSLLEVTAAKALPGSEIQLRPEPRTPGLLRRTQKGR